MTDELKELIAYKSSHLAWPVPPEEKLSRLPEDELTQVLQNRKIFIENAERDPMRHGYVPAIWKTAVWHLEDLRKKFPRGVIKLIILGGNRSGKSAFATNYVLRKCVEHPEYRVWCCDSTEAMSRSNQMRLLYNQFPPEWKNLPKNKVTDVGYSLADGFSKNKVVFPNKSEVDFKFYSMDIANLPGPELNLIYGDELIPLEWVETLVYRLINRDGTLLITFTPELGWSETYGYFYEGAQEIETEDAPLLPRYDEEGKTIGYKRVPRVMQCSDPTARIIFFHTSDNPFGNYPALVQQLKNKGEDEILIRAYGVCSKSHSVAFPMFSQKAHVITQEQFRLIEKQFPEGERYHLVDPCDGRMWFMIWVFCPRPDKWIIYREYPSCGHPSAYIQGVGMPGPWALSGAAADGVKGPAQNTQGFSLERYIEEILNQEQAETILERYIDSRYATSPKSERERMTTLIEQLGEAGMDFLAMVPGKGRIIGLESNDGSVDMINSALYYDVETEIGQFSSEAGRLNEPQLQVLDTCPNVIYALEHWTGKDGQKGACKDPVDCIRGMFLTSVMFQGAPQWSSY